MRHESTNYVAVFTTFPSPTAPPFLLLSFRSASSGGIHCSRHALHVADKQRHNADSQTTNDASINLDTAPLNSFWLGVTTLYFIMVRRICDITDTTLFYISCSCGKPHQSHVSREILNISFMKAN